MTIGQIGPEEGARSLAERAAEKAALVEAMVASGALVQRPAFDAAMDDALAAAIHAWVAHSGSALASVQVDDLAGETVATNLPGTDRERPNWRHRSRDDTVRVFEEPRAQAILKALNAVRPRA